MENQKSNSLAANTPRVATINASSKIAERLSDQTLQLLMPKLPDALRSCIASDATVTTDLKNVLAAEISNFRSECQRGFDQKTEAFFFRLMEQLAANRRVSNRSIFRRATTFIRCARAEGRTLAASIRWLTILLPASLLALIAAWDFKVMKVSSRENRALIRQIEVLNQKAALLSELQLYRDPNGILWVRVPPFRVPQKVEPRGAPPTFWIQAHNPLNQ